MDDAFRRDGNESSVRNGPHPVKIAPKRRLPDALIIGVKKGGTRTLLTFLQKHPQIVANSDELHFFDKDANFSKGLEWYRKQMPAARPDQVILEKTPIYFPSLAAPERIYDSIPNVKLILIVRDPIVRLVSDYLHEKIHYRKTWSLEEAVTNTAQNGSLAVIENRNILKLSLYDEAYSRYMKFFKPEQMLILSGEKFIRDPWVELEKVQSFLGVRQAIRKENFYFNPEKQFMCMRSTGVNGFCMGDNKGRKHPKVAQKVYQVLKEYFTPSVNRFALLSQSSFCNEWLHGEV
ncbi:heparan sulfate glucosamine 3-O-sulfotransferase 5-like [Neocloeon triangulifer]|uniref:heparan sulfate glucosamine 3-O-sulfotransferase 5-like n=1 Tax=Neocloeon triangulifer TaxID=2078957 RepID=UPI00286EC48F|nr:heparan sulfate glucosamine 3-O-sulfotransferase 5-like [Neocloeon triangulifer]